MHEPCISHTDTPFDIHPDYIDVCDQDHAQAVACTLLETMTNERLAFFEKAGIAAYEEDLWIEADMPAFAERALHLYGISTLKGAMQALERRGFISVRYIKRDQAGACLGVYSTYQEARTDGAWVIIAKQYLFHCGVMQEAIAGRLSQPRDRKNTQTPLAEDQSRGKQEGLRTYKHTALGGQNQQGRR